MQLNIFEYLPKDKPATPPFPLSKYDYNDPRRPLTSREASWSRYQMIIVMPSFIEQPINLEKAERTIVYLYKMYPFFKSEVVFDEKI